MAPTDASSLSLAMTTKNVFRWCQCPRAIIEAIAVRRDGARTQQESQMMLGPVASEQRGSMLELFLVGPERVGMLWPGRDPPLPLTGYLDLWLWINFSKPQFSHLEDGTNDNVRLRIVLCASFCSVSGMKDHT